MKENMNRTEDSMTEPEPETVKDTLPPVIRKYAEDKGFIDYRISENYNFDWYEEDWFNESVPTFDESDTTFNESDTTFNESDTTGALHISGKGKYYY